jgi:hypothetical protein
MANLITTAVTWEGQQSVDYFLKPLFIGKDPMTMGFRIMTNIQSSKKLNYFDSFSKQTKAYAQGFSGTNASTYTQRTIEVVQLKTEAAQDANVFYDTVFEQIQKKGWEWNDVAGTQLEQIVLELFRNGVSADIYRLFWLADEATETLSDTTYGTATGTADTRYNMFDGLWTLIFDNAATSPTSSQIKRLDINSTTYLTTAAVAQVTNCTPSLSSGGSAGGGNITVDGVDYDITWSTNVKTTVEAFISDHATALLVRHIVATEDDNKIILTSAIPGRPFVATYTAASGSDLLVAVAAGTPNTAPSTMKADGALAAFRKLYTDQPVELKSMPDNKKVIHCDWDTFNNYKESLEEDGIYTSMAKTMIIDGVETETLKFRGITIMPHNWGEYLDDTPHASGANPARYSRILLTVADNIILGIDGSGDDTKLEFWYNKDEQENRMRVQWRMGVQYIHNNLMVVAY